jgi:signal transduction histidine kinase
VLDDFGLVTALRMLCREFEALHAIRTTFELGNSIPRDLDPNVEIALYRIAQEALSNIARHAKASTASLHLLRNEFILRLILEDDGEGFWEEQASRLRETGHGLGLISMRERTELLGGQFEVDSAPGKGTTVSVTIPVGEQTDNEEDANSDR